MRFSTKVERQLMSLVFLLCFFGFANAQQELPDGVEPSWFNQAKNYIEKSEYFAHQMGEDDQFLLVNRAQNLRATVSPSQILISPRSDENGAWEASLKVTSIHRQETKFQASKLQSADIQVNENQIRFDFGPGSVEYVNNEEGIRQNFYVNYRPAGEGNLTLQMDCGDGLLPVQKSREEIAFVRKAKVGETAREVFWYEDLKVWDAEGKSLEAWMEVEGEMLALVVDDRNAVYPVTIDPLSSTHDWFEEGANSYDGVGWSVSSAGDLNGDLISDVIIGVPYFTSTGGTYEGAAFVYYGTTSGLPTSPDWVAEGGTANMIFGRSVSTAGDVDGDGYSDIVVGAPSNSFATGSGVYVFHGSASGLANGPTTTSATANWSRTATFPEQMGHSVACAGDVNADGLSDVIVGLPGMNNFFNTQIGRVRLWHGNTGTGLTVGAADWSITESVVGLTIGYSVASAGDVNADGDSEVIVGCTACAAGQSGEGAALVWYGSGTGLPSNGGNETTASWGAQANQAGAGLGHDVASAGDVNGDGYADIIASAMNYTTANATDGAVFVWHGSSTGLVAGGGSPANADWEAGHAQTTNTGILYGMSVACAGDVNGDGYSDVLIGATGFDENPSTVNVGAALMWQGGPGGLITGGGTTANADWVTYGSQFSSLYGYEVASAGDINGDGFSDVLVGAPSYDGTSTTDAGRAYEFHGSPNGIDDTPAWADYGGIVDGEFGYSVASVGDGTHDGLEDIVIGAPFIDLGTPEMGQVFIFEGNASGISTTPSITLSGSAAGGVGERFGFSVASAGDNNQNHHTNLLIGAPYYSGTNVQEGRAYMYELALGGPSTLMWSQAGQNANDHFGYSVACAGDFLGDGFLDIVVGAPDHDNGLVNEGKVYVYNSVACKYPLTTPAWTAEGDLAGIRFGASVASAGMQKSTGNSSIIIGAPNYSPTQTNEGGVFVYYSGTSGLLPATGANTTNAGWSASSGVTNAYMGASVACAGDVDGNGYSDIIVGSSGYSNGNTNEGAAFVWLNQGGTNGLGATNGTPANADWVYESGQTSAYAGISAASAGDVNGDGYDDVIVGTPFWDGGQADEGKADVFLGSASGISLTPYWTQESNEAGAWFGYSVACAGDVNGDGYDDVLIGMPKSSNTLTKEGQAQLFYGNGVGGLRLDAQQYDPYTSLKVISPGTYSTKRREISLAVYAKNFLGTTDGLMLYEIRPEDNALSTGGGTLTNSVATTGSQASLSTLSGGGLELKEVIGGLNSLKRYHWRARTFYDPVTAITGQVTGPWKYQPNPHEHWGGFWPKDIPACKTIGDWVTEELEENPSEVKVFPNPVSENGLLSVALTGKYADKDWKVSLSDVTGKRILLTKGTGSTIRIPLTGVSAGLYQLNLWNEQFQINKKIVVAD